MPDHYHSGMDIRASMVDRAVASTAEAVVTASERLAPYALETPLVRARSLASHAYFKCENLQRTGSFKVRGALNKVLMLTPDERERGVVASSTGNHGLAVAEALRLTSGRGTVVVSASAAGFGGSLRTMPAFTLAGSSPITPLFSS